MNTNIIISERSHNINILPDGNGFKQYIVSGTYNKKKFIFNFNSRKEIDIVGKFDKKCNNGYINLFKIKPNVWYKRKIFNRSIELIEMTDIEIEKYLNKNKTNISTSR